MEIKQLKDLIKKLVELDKIYQYTILITQIRTNLTQLKSQRNPQTAQVSMNVVTRQQQVATLKNTIITSANNAIKAIQNIQEDLGNYKFGKILNQLKIENPYNISSIILLNKVISEIDYNIDTIIQELNTYHLKLQSYNQFLTNSETIFSDIIDKSDNLVETNNLILFFEGEANVENLKELSKVSTDWNQIINCFGRLTNENDTDINIVSIEKGSLVATLTIAAAIIGGVITASDKVLNLILKVYEIRVKALELKKMKFDNIAAAIEILEKQASIDLSEQSKSIVKELMKEYGWEKTDALYNETESATIKAVKKMIRFHNSGGKVDADLLEPNQAEIDKISTIRNKNAELLKIENEIINLTGSSKILQIEDGEINDDEE